jgi:hypothetical protein
MEGHHEGEVGGAPEANAIEEPQSLGLAEWQPIQPDILAQRTLPRRIRRLSTRFRHSLALPMAEPWRGIVVGFAPPRVEIPTDRILRAPKELEHKPRPIPYARFERRARPWPVAPQATPETRPDRHLRTKSGLLKITAFVAVTIAWALFYISMKALLGPKDGMAASSTILDGRKNAER